MDFNRRKILTGVAAGTATSLSGCTSILSNCSPRSVQEVNLYHEEDGISVGEVYLSTDGENLKISYRDQTVEKDLDTGEEIDIEEELSPNAGLSTVFLEETGSDSLGDYTVLRFDQRRRYCIE